MDQHSANKQTEEPSRALSHAQHTDSRALAYAGAGASRALANGGHANSRALSAQMQRSPVQLMAKDEEQERAVTAADVRYELFAHGLAYMDELTPEQIDLVKAWGFEEGPVGGWSMMVKDEATGFFAGLLLPNPYAPNPAPHAVLAFRGTHEGVDWTRGNADPYAVGYNTLMAKYASVNRMIGLADGPVVMTGHSLGGSLAKQAAIAFPGSAASVFAYQAPGVNRSQDQTDLGVPVVNHIADTDIVHQAGGGRLQGHTYMHHPRYRLGSVGPVNMDIGKSLMAHMDFLLSGEEYTEQQEAVTPEGWSWNEVLTTAANNPEKKPVTNGREADYHDTSPVGRSWHEGARSGLGGGIGFFVGLVNEADPAELRALPIIQREIMIHTLMNTRTIQIRPKYRAVYKLMETAGGADLVAVVNQLGIERVLGMAFRDGGLDQLFLNLLRSRYYPNITVDEAAKVIEDRINWSGLTSDANQEIVRDVLLNHPQARSVIARVGEGNYQDGLDRILRNTWFEEDRQIRSKFQ
ncbi:MAG: hypothetical protein WBB45_06425 [Cyclobacteriaceae bacterium]